MNQLFLVVTRGVKTKIPDILPTRRQFSLIEIFALKICLPVVTQTQGVTNMRVLRRNLRKQQTITVNYMHTSRGPASKKTGQARKNYFQQ